MDRESVFSGDDEDDGPSFIIEHPIFGKVVFSFDSEEANDGTALSGSFILDGTHYPEIYYGFQRKGRTFVPDDLNEANRVLIDDKWISDADLTPPPFQDFALTKAAELADALKLGRVTNG
jgi:hypothetical protein